MEVGMTPMKVCPNISPALGLAGAALALAIPQDPAAATRRHALAEAVDPLAVPPFGLIGTLDRSDPFQT